MSGADSAPPRAVIFGCHGLELGDGERRLFADARPLGFILFERNCRSPDQVRALVGALREAVGRLDAPVLIDQEGGRVSRLKPPGWRMPPPARRFGELAAADEAAGRKAAWLNARLMADELAGLGITVDCAPVLDIPAPGGHQIIGDRAFGDEPATVSLLGAETCRGLLAGGVLPVIKHIPGHGRARADSHLELPAVAASRDELAAVDFEPFRALNQMPWGMTAHVLYTAIDADAPATVSPGLINDVIRGEIGFDGVLLSDDLGMKALSGGLVDRARAALAAGCDVALHCSGDLAEMVAVAAVVAPLGDAALERLARGHDLAARARAPAPPDMAAQLDALMAQTAGG